MVAAGDIKGLDLFAGLDETELDRIAKLCTAQTYERDSIIFSPNLPATDIYLLKGENDAVQIELPLYEHSPKTVIHTVRKGEIFGWAALVPPHLRTASARCIHDAEVISLNGKALTDLFKTNNHMAHLVWKNLCGIISSRLTYTTVALRYEIQKLAQK